MSKRSSVTGPRVVDALLISFGPSVLRLDRRMNEFLCGPLRQHPHQEIHHRGVVIVHEHNVAAARSSAPQDSQCTGDVVRVVLAVDGPENRRPLISRQPEHQG